MIFYEYDKITDNDLKKVWSESPVVTTKAGAFYNIAVSFDIETSSWYANDSKIAHMYVWSFDLNGFCFYGRTWHEYCELCNRIVKIFDLGLSKRLIIYVQNLAYEFQFIRNWFEWDSVFAREIRKPMKAVTTSGIEYRCSYMLSRYSLDLIAKNLQNHKISKLKGDLDYRLIRNCNTPLSEEELGYCYNDVKIVEYYIREEIDRNGDITKIPLTQTGYVRRECRNNCMYLDNHKRNESYCHLINSLLLDCDEYKQLLRAFAGGFTHASCFYSGELIEDVDSFDFTSSYPYVMCSEKYPMSSSKMVSVTDKKTFDYYCSKYGCVFDIEFEGLESKILYEHIISQSKCIKMVNGVIDNGRVVRADYILLTITNIDFESISKFYEWDRFSVHNFRYYQMDYLPTEFVDTILTFYENKTKLKGVEGSELEYMHSKEMANSCYGMIVTNIAPKEVEYGDDWKLQAPDLVKQINNYNGKKNRFLFYPWGIWVTAYARRNLFSGILAFKGDYIYSDTDSCKITNSDKHMEYILKYNATCLKKLELAMKHHGFSVERTRPKTKEGVEKPLGVWDFDGRYKYFKTLGAKRYLSFNDKYHLTVSGVNKKEAVPYLISLSKRENVNVFDLFTDKLLIPAEHTGKLTHTYLDYPQHGIVKDYLGNEGEYIEKSSAHLEPASYEMGLAAEYIEFLKEIRFKNE